MEDQAEESATNKARSTAGEDLLLDLQHQADLPKIRDLQEEATSLTSTEELLEEQVGMEEGMPRGLGIKCLFDNNETSRRGPVAKSVECASIFMSFDLAFLFSVGVGKERRIRRANGRAVSK